MVKFILVDFQMMQGHYVQWYEIMEVKMSCKVSLLYFTVASQKA